MLKGLNQVNPDSQGFIWPSSQPNQHIVNMKPREKSKFNQWNRNNINVHTFPNAQRVKQSQSK